MGELKRGETIIRYIMWEKLFSIKQETFSILKIFSYNLLDEILKSNATKIVKQTHTIKSKCTVSECLL